MRRLVDVGKIAILGCEVQNGNGIERGTSPLNASFTPFKFVMLPHVENLQYETWVPEDHHLRTMHDLVFIIHVTKHV